MGKIFNYLGFVIFFYSEDHTPIHVHVRKNKRESKFEFHYTNGILKLVVKKIKSKKPLTEPEIKKVKTFLSRNDKAILQCWTDFFVLNKKPKFVIINKIIK